MAGGDGISTVVWCEPAQVGLVRRVVEIAGLRLAAAGSPARGQSGAVAGELGCRAVDDLRHVLATGAGEGVRLVWMASAGEFGTQSADAQAVTGTGLAIAASEPVPASAIELAAGGWAPEAGPTRPCDGLRFVPLMRSARAVREAGEVMAALGPVRLAAIEHWGGPERGSLGAAVFSAIEFVHSVLGEPDTIDAAYVGPAQIPGLHALPGESLRDLRGDLTANLRFSDGRAASLTLSSQAGRWERRATLVGASSVLRFEGGGFELVGTDGTRKDEMKARARPAVDPAADAIAESLVRLVDSGKPDGAPIDVPAVLSIAQAALLSARTGQAESPATVRRMAGMT